MATRPQQSDMIAGNLCGTTPVRLKGPLKRKKPLPMNTKKPGPLQAGAAQCDGHVEPVVRLELRQPAVQIAGDVVDHAVDVAAAVEEFAHRGVESSERPQFRLPVGVGQTAQIEHQVRIHRHAELEAEGPEQQ